MQIKEIIIRSGEFTDIDGTRFYVDEDGLTVIFNNITPEKGEEEKDSNVMTEDMEYFRERMINQFPPVVDVDIVSAEKPVRPHQASKEKKKRRPSLSPEQIEANIINYFKRQKEPVEFSLSISKNRPPEKIKEVKENFEAAGSANVNKLRTILKDLVKKGILKITKIGYRTLYSLAEPIESCVQKNKEQSQKISNVKTVYEEDNSKEPTKDELETRVLSFFQQKDYSVLIDWENEWYRELCKAVGTDTRWRIEAALNSLVKMQLLEKESKNGSFQYSYKKLKNAETPANAGFAGANCR